MKRTTAVVLSFAMSLTGTAVAQEGGNPALQDTQAKAVEELVASVVGAESAVVGLRKRMTTRVRVTDGYTATTRGELRVLRGTQPDTAPRMFSRLEYEFGDGLRGRVETARTAAGIVMFEEGPAFGAVFVRISPAIVRDLEWAGRVLKREDLPGMADARADSPLGSGLIRDLQRTFDLRVDDRKERDGDAGTWLVGTRKQGLDEQDPDLPLADRVDVFVRSRDHAVLLASYRVGDEVVQELVVDELELGVEFGDDAFVVDGHGERVRDVQQYTPMWEMIERTLLRAEAKAPAGELRPSKR